MSNPFDTLSDDINDYCFIDSETRALETAQGLDGDLTKVGVDVYKENAFAVMWTYCIGDGREQIMALDDGFDERLTWDYDASDELKAFHERVEAGEAWYVAWNMGFDRNIWNGPESDFPHMRADMSLDLMVQGASSGLPGKLGDAGRKLGLGEKQSDGGSLINLFAPANGATPQTRPDEWERYKMYGLRDTTLLRDIFRHTRPLPRQEWQDYWVSEAINARGLPVDVGFARRAEAVANLNISRINAALNHATNGKITAVTQAVRIRDWVYDRLDSAEARDLMVKTWELDGEDDLKPAKLSLDKPRMEKLIAYFDNRRDENGDLQGQEQTIYEVIEHRLFGGSSSPAKFGKMGRMQVGGMLRNQYVFNGASQTGRYSSRGVQIHNLLRKSLGKKEAEFMEMINDIELA